MLPSLSHLMLQTFASKTGHNTARPYFAGTWVQGSSTGEFRLDLSAASQVQHQRRSEVFEGLASRGTDNLNTVRKVVTRAFKDATQTARVESTGGTSFRKAVDRGQYTRGEECFSGAGWYAPPLRILARRLQQRKRQVRARVPEHHNWHEGGHQLPWQQDVANHVFDRLRGGGQGRMHLVAVTVPRGLRTRY